MNSNDPITSGNVSFKTRSHVVLASTSSRRSELLSQIGIAVAVVPPISVGEEPARGELPVDLACRLSLEKADSIVSKYSDNFVLGADTVVSCGRRILPKAKSESEAYSCLNFLSGRRHRVYGGVTIISPTGVRRTRVVTTVVSFKSLTNEEINVYLTTGEWRGMAGGYAIQGRAATFVRFIRGSYTNVVGLPLFEVSQILNGLGYQRKK